MVAIMIAVCSAYEYNMRGTNKCTSRDNSTHFCNEWTYSSSITYKTQCFPEDAIVITPTGSKNISDLTNPIPAFDELHYATEYIDPNVQTMTKLFGAFIDADVEKNVVMRSSFRQLRGGKSKSSTNEANSDDIDIITAAIEQQIFQDADNEERWL